MAYIGQTEYDHKGQGPKTGVLLTNLGTPDAPTTPALRRYLREFLSDPRVVEVPRLIWWMILHGVILRFRPRRSAKLYQSVWTKDGSPLLSITKQQAQKLQQSLDQKFGASTIPVEVGMRYGNPSISSAIKTLTEANVRRLVILPLYPQYSGATTGSTFDAIAHCFIERRWVPDISFIGGYHQHPSYICAIAESIKQHIQTHGMPDKLLLSYHGTPQRYLTNGDPYSCFCQQTSRLITETLKLPADRVLTTFQSRFGREPWLQPYTDVTLKALPSEGHKHIALLCPGFSTDCLETLEEIEVENRELFMAAGGEQFHYIPCLNDSQQHIDMMQQLVEERLL